MNRIVVGTTNGTTRGLARGLARGSARHAARGFSLLELTLVIVIIGVLMSIVAVNVLGRGEQAKKRATEASLATIKSALNAYNLESSAYPPDLRTLVTTKYLEDGKMKDGWGNDFYYDPRGRSKDQPFILGSPGSDKQPGNEDDINVWTMQR